MTDGPAGRLRKSVAVAAVYLLALVWILGKAALFRERVPPGVPPDEPVHVSYVVWLEASGALLPRYEEMRLLEADGRFGAQPSYLAHPPAYYHLLRGLARVTGGVPAGPLDAGTRRLRALSAPLFAAAAALFLWLGFRRAAPLPAHALYAASVATVPPLAFVGSAVNNDVLAFLAGGLALLGLARLLEGRAGARTGTLVGAGLALALLSKATAGLLVLLAAAAALALARRAVRWERDARFLLALAPWLLLPALHYVPILVRYGTPVPSLEVVDPEAFARSAFVEAPGAPRLADVPWAVKLLKVFGSTWLSLIAHVWLPVGPLTTLAGPALAALLAALGLFRRRGPGDVAESAADDLVRAGAVALAATLLVNLAWARDGYVATGRLGGIHARYYLPLLPVLALAAARGLERVPARALLAAAVVLLLVLFDAGVTARYLALFPAP
jgi:4-amino-4-deoxy-L-arabinose transferase-like glycosyltransferase